MDLQLVHGHVDLLVGILDGAEQLPTDAAVRGEVDLHSGAGQGKTFSGETVGLCPLSGHF